MFFPAEFRMIYRELKVGEVARQIMNSHAGYQHRSKVQHKLLSCRLLSPMQGYFHHQTVERLGYTSIG